MKKYEEYNSTFNIAKSIAVGTEILVVIGYSFPFFNREIDRVFIKEMTHIEKIFIQDIRADELVSHFRTMFKPIVYGNPKLIPINYTESFYLPPEL